VLFRNRFSYYKIKIKIIAKNKAKKDKVFKQSITTSKKNETDKSDWLRHVISVVSNKIKA